MARVNKRLVPSFQRGDAITTHQRRDGRDAYSRDDGASKIRSYAGAWEPAKPAYGEFAARACQALDWLPIRAAAFSFAIVGNFQDALESWRGQSHAWGDVNQGVLLAAGAGALGVQLGGTIVVTGGELLRPPLGGDEPPGPETIDGAIALVLRAVLLWLAVAGLIWLGSL
jgi:adenosylcobinamide-phosphate synthase